MTCYYHDGRIAVFKIAVEGGGTVPVCASCYDHVKTNPIGNSRGE